MLLSLLAKHRGEMSHCSVRVCKRASFASLQVEERVSVGACTSWASIG
ncbi:unnamed protein product [Chondrus crispus]|uniref:Uncharacterized protein n=1 Tax=Chondrus crispus TaxID=2769 RepID=R7QQ22_CHOCR|nr:unnamed protein product [Chondrus crispus]CDF39571.1 unnamed protein product [Chondrus crispus]|eukprot:XP_005709865.1 unnamed protein product [Chondrus crispus]